MNDEKQETLQERELMPLWEVFIRPRTGLSHSHVGSVHASDEVMAVQAARDVYTRRGEGVSIWVCLLYTSPSPRDGRISRMPSSA